MNKPETAPSEVRIGRPPAKDPARNRLNFTAPDSLFEAIMAEVGNGNLSEWLRQAAEEKVAADAAAGKVPA